MTRFFGLLRLRRLGLVGVVACTAVLTCCGTAVAAAATAPWTPLSGPWRAWAINDAYAFGAGGLAVVGDDGHIGITRDGGATWKVVVPPGLEAAVFTAVAFNGSGRGAVASGGLLLVTADWGVTWRLPAYDGPAPRAGINDLAMSGPYAVAVGGEGVIMTSSDGGATWRSQTVSTTSALHSVAVAGDGVAVAGSAAGEILVGDQSAWKTVRTLAGPVTAVAACPDPAWGDGHPDLFAATGADVLGSDDALTFASLPGLPDLSTQALPVLAWTGVPERSLLLAGARNAGFFETLSQRWLAVPPGPDIAIARATAPRGESVAYLLSTDGRLVRTLSAGREPATVEATATAIIVGAGTTLNATVFVGAPGDVLLRQRVPGRSWTTARTVAWTPADWGRVLAVAVKPTLTTEYRVDFRYGSTTTVLSPVRSVAVTPKVNTARGTYTLRVGDVYRFSGSVTPTLRGEKVELYTDRGGGWRKVSQQGSVSLKNGRTWTSRAFGTPKAETYHLRAYVKATRTHGEAWSRIVTVRIRR